ncbi:Glycosyltransferase family 22 protein [Mycena kentingensis (nom. inval.)]|nr:Glycosyltransferase family 22 protein [Mycena kentingensis (nom. inval.)]
MDRMSEESDLTSLAESNSDSDDEMMDVESSSSIHQVTTDQLLHLLPDALDAFDRAYPLPTEEACLHRAVLLKVTKDLRELGNGQHKFALIGMTGVGKSTLLNALLGKRVVGSSGEGAGTTVPAEISFLPGQYTHVCVEFISHEEWNRVLDGYFAEATNTSVDTEEPATAKNTATLSISSAREKLLGLFPQLDGIPTDNWNKSSLLAEESVVSLLGRVKEWRYATSLENIQQQLNRDLISASNFKSSRALYLLIKCIKIRGPFPVLSAGVTLVDLPVYGDVDVARDRAAKDYLTSADSIILVAGIVRAANHSAFIAQLHHHLESVILAGRAHTKTISIVLTGADQRAEKDEIHLPNETEAVVQRLDQTVTVANNQITKLKKKLERSSHRKMDTAKAEKLAQKIEQQNKKVAETRQKMNLMLANARADNTRTSLKEKCEAIVQNFLQGRDVAVVPSIPIFCVGSRDHMCLTGLDVMHEAETFFEKDQTGVPALQRYLQDSGERMQLPATRDALGAVCEFLRWAQTPEVTKSTVSEETTQILGALKGRCLNALEKMVSSDVAAYTGLMQTVQDAIDKAKEQSAAIIRLQECRSWRQYRSMMLHHGRYDNGDLNEDLTAGIWSAVGAQWYTTLNETIPMNDQIFREYLRRQITDTLLAFVSGPLHLQLSSHRSHLQIIYENLMSTLETTRRVATTRAQGKSIRIFAEKMEEGLTPQYEKVAQEKGPGMFRRMKEANRMYIASEAQILFGYIGKEVGSLFETPLSRMAQVDRAALELFFKKLDHALARGVQASAGTATSEARNVLRAFAASHVQSYDTLKEEIDTKINDLRSKDL